ncbi:MAG TPA: nucleotidyltransferase family protein [Vicinamibacteria bacterium]|nr:nucleotidyltransferase family protein [Vicinamibacteria bacterium]
MIAALILSAGESRRMGSPKALLPFPLERGGETTFLERLLHVLQTSRARPILVVLGHEPDRIREAVDLTSVRQAVNSRYREGMLSSIQCGIEALAESDVDGALICPVDHPRITTDVVNTLITRFEATGAPVVLPIQSARRGHPVLFSAAVFPELLRAPRAVGARQVVWDHGDDLLEVQVTESGVRVDIDTPADYRSFRERKG